MSNQRIIDGFIVMMNPCFSFSALMYGISAPISTAVSPITALSRGWCTELFGGYGLKIVLDLMVSPKETTCSSRSGHWAIRLTTPELVSNRSLGGLGLYSLVRCLVSPPCHHMPSRSSPGQTPYNNCPSISWSLLVAARLCFCLHWQPVYP